MALLEGTDLTLREQRAVTAQALRSEGLKYREIAERMGLSTTYVHDLVIDPTGEKVRARKASYGGTCEACGAATNGSDGRANAPTLCKACTAQRQHDERYWTAKRIIAWIQAYVAKEGKVPPATILVTTTASFGTQCVQREFGPGGWRKAVRLAGFEPIRNGDYGFPGPLSRDHPTIVERLRLLAEGVSVAEVAQRQGVTTSAVNLSINRYINGKVPMARLSPTAVLEREQERAEQRLKVLLEQIEEEERNVAGLTAALEALAAAHSNGKK